MSTSLPGAYEGFMPDRMDAMLSGTIDPIFFPMPLDQ